MMVHIIVCDKIIIVVFDDANVVGGWNAMQWLKT
jgi:hypothetical protein